MNRDKNFIHVSNQFQVNDQLQYNDSNLETQKVDDIFFTVNLPKEVGISDQLWHLSKLYSLGIALSYTYVHTPFECPRSYRIGYLEKLIVALKKLINKHTDSKKLLADKLVQFIGLDKHDLNVSDQRFKDYRIIKINLDEILGANNFVSVSDLKKCIEGLDLSPKYVIYSFVTQGIYKFEAKIDHIVSSANLDDRKIKGLKLSEKYWQLKDNYLVNSPLKKEKIKVVVHIRKGDRTCIDINGKLISIFGSSIKVVKRTDDIEELNALLGDTAKAYNLIQEIFSRYGKEHFSVIVISDGYQKTFAAIIKAIILGKIKLRIDDLKQLYRIKKTLNREFEVFSRLSNVSLIVGESKKNLFQSIHAIVCADILIVTSGGFAYWLHKFFRKSNQLSMIINLNSYDNQTIDKVRNIVSKSL